MASLLVSVILAVIVESQDDDDDAGDDDFRSHSRMRDAADVMHRCHDDACASVGAEVRRRMHDAT